MAEHFTLRTRSQFASIIDMQKRWSQVREEPTVQERWRELISEYWAQQNCALDNELDGLPMVSMPRADLGFTAAVHSHVCAAQLLIDLAQGRPYLNSSDLLAVHRVLMGLHSSAGRFREQELQPSGGHEPTDVELIAPVVENVWQWFRSDSFMEMHEVERTALMLIKLIDIHPFDCGNGKTVRLVSNFFLLKGGYPPAIIEAARSAEYAAAAAQALRLHTQPMVDLIVAAVDSSFRHLLNESALPPTFHILNS